MIPSGLTHDLIQELGNAIMRMCSSNGRERFSGYADYYCIRNHAPATFDAYIDALDAFRVSTGHRLIRDIIKEIREDLVDDGRVSDCQAQQVGPVPQEIPNFPALQPQPVLSEVGPLKRVHCEQLSLFEDMA